MEPLHSYQGEHYEEEHTKPHIVYRKTAPKKRTTEEEEEESSACDASGGEPPYRELTGPASSASPAPSSVCSAALRNSWATGRCCTIATRRCHTD